MYKTILIHADQCSGLERHLQVAAALASEAVSHLKGTVASGEPQLDYLVYGAATLAAAMPTDYEPLRDAAPEQPVRFDEHCRQPGVTSYENHLQDNSAADALILQSLRCDLVDPPVGLSCPAQRPPLARHPRWRWPGAQPRPLRRHRRERHRRGQPSGRRSAAAS